MAFVANRLRPALKGEFGAGLLLALLALAFLLGRWLRMGEGIPGSDLANQDYPLKMYWVQSLHAGRLPLWNPYEMAGIPFAANPQTGIFYPPSLVFLILPFGPALVLFEVFHLTLAGVGSYAFLRRGGVSRRSALVSGAACMFSGVLVVHLDVLPALQTAAWLPVVLWLLERAWQEKNLAAFATASVGVGLQLLAGFPTFILCTVFASGCYGLYRSGTQLAGRQPGWYRPLLSLILIWALGLMLAAILWIPAIELIALSARSDIGMALAVERSYPIQNVLTWVIPDVFGSSVTHNAIQGATYIETTVYIGVTSLILATLALGSRQISKRRDAWFLTGLAGGAAVLALGPQTPLYGIARAIVPGFHWVGDPYRLIWLSGVSLCLLAGYGADRVCSGELGAGLRKVYSLLFWGSGLASGGALLLLLVYPLYASAGRAMIQRFYANPDEKIAKLPSLYQLQLRELIILAVLLSGLAVLFWMYRRGRLPAAWLGSLMVILVVADLWAFGLKFVWVGQYVTEPGYPACVRQAVADQETRVLPVGTAVYAVGFKTGLTSQVASVVGYDPLMLRNYRQLLAAVEGVPDSALDARAPQVSHYNAPGWAAFNVGYILSDQPLADGLEQVADCQGLHLYRAPRPGKPAWLAQSVIWVDPSWSPTPAEVSALGPDGPVYVERPTFGGLEDISHSGAASPAQITLRSRSSNRSLWDLELKQPGIIVWSESWYPGWRARIDGVEAETLRANQAFLAVQVPAGRHQLEWVFDSVLLRIGAGFSAAGLVVVAIMFWLGVRRP